LVSVAFLPHELKAAGGDEVRLLLGRPAATQKAQRAGSGHDRYPALGPRQVRRKPASIFGINK
jgi:hypothetical protein